MQCQHDIESQMRDLNRQRGVWARTLAPTEVGGPSGYAISYGQACETYVQRVFRDNEKAHLETWANVKGRLRKAMAQRMH